METDFEIPECQCNDQPLLDSPMTVTLSDRSHSNLIGAGAGPHGAHSGFIMQEVVAGRSALRLSVTTCVARGSLPTLPNEALSDMLLHFRIPKLDTVNYCQIGVHIERHIIVVF